MENSGIRLKKGNLLIVDDDIELRDTLFSLLEPYADVVHLAATGKEASQIVQTGNIDAVLTDIKMPVMTGLEFLAEIRGLYFQTPVIVLTGHGDHTMIQELLRLDATDYVEKPSTPENLVLSVRRALGLGCALREMESQVDLLYARSGLPANEVAKIKKIKKIVLGMKIGFSAYVKKNAS